MPHWGMGLGTGEVGMGLGTGDWGSEDGDWCRVLRKSEVLKWR